MGARRGARGGTCPPPLWKFKHMGPPKVNLTRKKMEKKISMGPHIVSEKTDLGGPYSKRRN